MINIADFISDVYAEKSKDSDTVNVANDYIISNDLMEKKVGEDQKKSSEINTDQAYSTEDSTVLRLRMLGYYNYENQHLGEEHKYPQKAKELADLLAISFKSLDSECIDTGEFQSLLDAYHGYAVFILEDSKGSLIAYWPHGNVVRFTNVQYNKIDITHVYLFENWFVPGEPITYQCNIEKQIILDDNTNNNVGAEENNNPVNDCSNNISEINETTSEQNKENQNEDKFMESNSKLFNCPDCGKMVSKKAYFCPNCGYSFVDNSSIIYGFEIGDKINVETDKNNISGVIRCIDRLFFEISLSDETISRIKYKNVSSISYSSKIIDNDDIEPSPILFRDIYKPELLTQIDEIIREIYKIENINPDDYIKTNATVESISYYNFYVITDGGKTLLCKGILGCMRRELCEGDRVYCARIKATKSNYIPIGRITYDDLRKKLIAFLKNYRTGTNLSKISPKVMINFLTETTNNEKSSLLISKMQKIFNSFKKNCEKELNYNENYETLVDYNDDTKLYKTDTEKKLFEGPKIVGKIDLTKINDSKKKYPKKFTELNESMKPSSKPSVVESATKNKILSGHLPMLSDDECKVMEKELDSLIREGKKEECLKKSYEILTTSKPNRKYFKSYLDRIVNTEISMEHNDQAIMALSLLIAFSEKQSDTKLSNLSHLYMSLARLLKKSENTDDVNVCLDWAIYFFPRNKTIADGLKLSSKTEEKKYNIDDNSSISQMLIQDVEQFAKTQGTLSKNPIELFTIASKSIYDKSKSFEFRSQLFLDAAAAYYNVNKLKENEFKLSLAHYARMRGDSLFFRISESVRKYPESRVNLIAECDSAKSYYLEALDLYNDLAQNGILQELLLKYLKVESLLSQIEGGKTPDTDWNDGTLKSKMNECLNDDNTESQKVLFRTCVAMGSMAGNAWKTLSKDPDGTGPFYGKLYYPSFRKKAYQLLNQIEQSSVGEELQPSAFLSKIFEHRQERTKDFKKHLENCLSWEFSQFDISTFEDRWANVIRFKDLMTSTDIKSLEAINEVINILRPYASRRDNERGRNLSSSQQILLKSQRNVADTTTYYGRVFFHHLQEKWLAEISRQLDERDASTLPKLEISPEPCYIKYDDEGRGVIDFVVSNNGDSTANSFTVEATINGKSYLLSHNAELPSGDCCGEYFVSSDFSNLTTTDVLFKLTPRYQGKDLKAVCTEAIYEMETDDVLTDDTQIPWKISNTPREDIFKGREENLNKLITHYLSKDRTQTYILYGLTRTGKSSILDYLCERIDGRSLLENSDIKIKTFKWDLAKIPFKSASISELWCNLVEVNIYNKLSDELADKVDLEYENHTFPGDSLRQPDLDVIVNVLNNNKIVPLITIDEFSYIRNMLETGLIDATFLSSLRDLALKGKACFVYAGTYDIKELPREKEYGIEGQMTNTMAMHISKIESKYADELIDACPYIIFDDKAKSYIRALSGCIPYWIQWICLDCGKYAVAHKKKHLGRNDVDHVVKVLTGEEQPSKLDNWGSLDETNFHNNQITPNDVAEHQLISCISYLTKESTEIERGISMDELKRLWKKYEIEEEKCMSMTKALVNLEEKKIIRKFTDETRTVYRINVDLFRRWWLVHHGDLNLEFSL